jgi:hypothetical protein
MSGCSICKKSWDMCKCKLEDLGIKLGSKEEAAWKDIKEGAEAEIAQFKRGIIVDEGIVKIAEEQMKEEHSKFCHK